MAYDIGPRIGVEGEADFRRQLRQVNDDIRTMGSEMKAVTSEFTGAEDSMEAYTAKSEVLTRQIGAQEDKLKLLTDRLERAKKEFDEGDDRINRYQREVYNATAQLNKMQAELKQTEQAMDDLGDETKESTSLFDKFKQKAGSFDLKGTLLKGFAVGTVINGVKELGGAVIDLVDNTREYRTIMASLDNSSKQAGYTAEETAATYEKLQGVLGDTQTAATATANLQALGLSQNQLTELTDAAIGAWSRYGDSIPIDGLAEAINETVQSGKVTGNFADVLNWAGESEDAFNEKLAAASTASERANLVLQMLAEQGLTQAGQGWQENNQAIIDANRNQDKMEAAMARLGGKFEPLVSGFRGLVADGINFLIDAGEGAFDFFMGFPGRSRQIGADILTGLWKGINDKVSWLKSQVKGVVDKIKSWFTGSEGFDTHSPSKWSEKVFANVMDGGAIGVKRNTGSVLRQVDAAVNAVKHDLSALSSPAVPVPNLGTVQSGSGVSAQALAQAVKEALLGTGVYLEGRKVGEIVTTAQSNTARGRGTSPVYG